MNGVQLSGEEVIGLRDDDEHAGLRQGFDDGAQDVPGSERVPRALNEEAWSVDVMKE